MFMFPGPHGLVAYRPDEGAGGGTEPPSRDPVPYDRFAQVASERAAEAAARAEAVTRAETAERELSQIQEAQQQAERAAMSDQERLKTELAEVRAATEAAQKRADDAEAARVRDQRAGWVETAATNARFHKPDRATNEIDISKVETREDAQRFVTELAEREQWMVAPDPAETKRVEEEAAARDKTTAADRIQQILDGGEPVNREGEGKQEAKSVIPAAEFNDLSGDQLVALQETNPDLYGRSLAAAASE